MQKVGVGVAGLGFMGKMHLGIYARSRAANLVAVCDASDRRRSGGLADVVGNIDDPHAESDLSKVKRYKDLNDMLADPDVEMVDICLPSFLHKKGAIAGLEAGRHVLCEKPLALSSADAKPILAAWKKQRRLLMVAHCVRFWPEYEFAREAVKTKRYGKPLSAVFRRYSPKPNWSWQDWMMNVRRSGGVGMDLHIHDADFVAQVFGMPSKVFASAPKLPQGKGAWISAVYDYGTKLHVTAEAAWVDAAAFPFSMSYTIVCEDGVLDYNSARETTLSVYGRDGSVQHPDIDGRDGYTREIEYFLRCVIDGRKPEFAMPDEAAAAVRLVEAELKSVATRRPVAVPKR